jgi:NAD(P)-dependent dehydrogenase (short-subunit alcohol dehydrogenase family)
VAQTRLRSSKRRWPPTLFKSRCSRNQPANAHFKHRVIRLTRTAVLEYVKGLIDTQIARDVVAGDEKGYGELAKNVPIGRAGRPEEIASVVLWLCSPEASYIIGYGLTVDGGMTVV